MSDDSNWSDSEKDQMAETACSGIDRRSVVRLLGGGIITAAVGSFAAGCGLEGSQRDPRIVTIRRDDVPEIDGDPYLSEVGKFFLVRNQQGVLALSWACTHMGCAVRWSGQDRLFRCPCHASAFSHDGNRLEGPASRPLDLFTIASVNEGNVEVIAGPRNERSSSSPDQVTGYE